MTSNINNNYSCQSNSLSTGVKTGKCPSIEEVEMYRKELESTVDAKKFYEYYAPDWTIADRPINDWKAVFRSWDRTQFKKPEKKSYMPKNTILAEDRNLLNYSEDEEFELTWRRIMGEKA
jgi:hypothetical protein